MKKWIAGVFLLLSILSICLFIAACNPIEDDCGGGTCPVVSNPFTDPANQSAN